MNITIILLAVLFLSGTAVAHPGRLNAQGCHNDRSTGTLHCHRSVEPRPSASAPAMREPNVQSGAQRPVYYPNCAAARAAGAAPIRRGQPGYGRDIDRDNDGVACE